MENHVLAAQLKTPHGEEGVKIGKMMHAGNAQMYALAMDHINFNNTNEILEIGFGNGHHIPLLLQKKAALKYAGIDCSQLMVEEANKMVRENRLESLVEIRIGNISSLPFKSSTFDTILTVNTLYFWEHPLEDAKEVLRVLKPGGDLLLSFRPKEMAEKLPFTTYGFQLYTLEEAKLLLVKAGFTRIEDYYQEGPTGSYNSNNITFSSYSLQAFKSELN